MKYLITYLFVAISLGLFSQEKQEIPLCNRQVIDTILHYGPSFSPTYESAVCTEFVIGVLGHFIELTTEDTIRIRIDQPRESIKDVYEKMTTDNPEPKGVYYALSANGKGTPIDTISKVLPGDFVQFWYPNSWGHCGIVHSMDLKNGIMYLYSSYPSTNGYGIQPFNIPTYCYFVRLK